MPNNNAPGTPAPVTGPAPMPTKTLPAPQPVTVPTGFPLPNAVENANAARGQQLIDAVKDIGRLDTTSRSPEPWPLAKPER